MAGMESLTKVIITLLIFFPFSVTASSDTLRQGDRLNSSSFLFSANQLFKLGFFTAEKYSGHSYLAIWYNSDPDTLPVWIGNRDTEIDHNSCVLAIDGAGNLIITDNVGKRIELYSAPSGINTTATLLNTGNLIVREVKRNESVLWQSFDYPSDTLLPGMKLRVNHRTSKKWTLMSWWNGEVGVSGAFTMEWDPIGQGLIVRRRGMNFWTTGVLGDKGFEFLDTNTNMLYKFRNVTSEDVDYLSYSLRDEESRRPISGWRLDDEGSIHEVTGLQISDGSLCYGYKNDFNKGCQLWQQPDECRYQYQSFQKRSGRIGAQQIDRVGNLSFSDCKANCWDDCACFGFQFDENATSCTFYRGNQSQFYQDLSSDPPQRYLLTDDPAQQSTTGVLSFHGHSGRKWIWIVIPAVSAFLLLVFGCLCYLRRRNIKLNGPHDDVTDRYMDSSELENGENKSNNLRVFSFRDIIAATNDFSPENELGKGGFGRVYKGKLLNGTEIAIKRLSERSSQGVEEFKNELILIAKLQHVNLVRLLGCCIHGDEKMLIYEYMPNKSLDYFLFDPIRKEQLAWQRRFNIIEGIAQGLLYLHKYSRLKIIHRDLKASNILLDDQMNPKISDFGMARIFKQNVLEANTKRVVGTYGYMAPEYAMKGMFSIKSDVFSFGVLILEIVSGQRTNSFRQIDGPLTLIEHAWELWNEDAALELMDPMLTHSCTKQLLRCVHVALLCVQDHAVDRPTIPDVISMLTNDSIALPLPKKPAFVFGKRVDEGGSNKRMLEKCSVNELSFSLEVPR